MTTKAKFDNGDPLIAIVDIMPDKAQKKGGRRLVRDVRLGDMKRVILIGKTKYVCASSQYP